MGARDKDLSVLHRLKELGSDLSKSHTVDFFLYFPSEEQAKSATSEISVVKGKNPAPELNNPS